ncbi:MAG: peptidoglycan DD-metalloendopeptidase family protein [Elusimicrobiaceae bacterium]|nr:peptidoglycan DD-metalloendopeptidase family protein [Elusimicrobiaceae bacterium]
MAKILGLFLLLSVVTSSAWADEAADRKQELAKLKSQAQRKEAELKKYREQEKKISKEITDLQSKQEQAQRLKNKVEKDLSLVEQNLVSIEDKRAALERSMPMWRGLAWQEAVQYYMVPDCPICAAPQRLEPDLFIDRMLAHQAAFAVTLQNENREAKESFAVFTEKNKSLRAQNSKLKAEQTVISQSFQKKQQDLDVTKRKVDAVRKEINELNKSATELNSLLASFERKRTASTTSRTSSSKGKTASPKISVPPHSLPWPVQGQVISQFGKEYRADLNTWIFRDGIKIAASYGAPVRASAQGSVIYAGPFRSYGNVVIMDHGKGFFTIYGFLREISVSVGDKVEQLGQVGKVGKDTQSSSGTGKNALYFEIRQGTTAVDPLDWLKK